MNPMGIRLYINDMKLRFDTAYITMFGGSPIAVVIPPRFEKILH